MANFWTGAHTKHRLRVHITWIPKYRRRVLIGKIAIRLRQLLYAACRINRWWIGEISIQKDHVHILIQIKADDSIAGVVHILKGGTSRVIRKEFPELEEFLWGDSFWTDGYFAETIGRLDEKAVENYIRMQSRQP